MMEHKHAWKRTLAVIAAVSITLGSLGFREHLPQRFSVYAKTVSEIEAEKKAKQVEIEKKKAEVTLKK